MWKAPRQFFLITLYFLLLSETASAAIINVPADQPTIQEGINITKEGDTVLISLGTYDEIISISNKNNLTIGSLFLTTQDTTYISQTIITGIAGEGFNRITRFTITNCSEIVLGGFTIINGGTGIQCSSSNLELKNITVKHIGYLEYGSGVVINGASNSVLKDIEIFHCHAGEIAYGIVCSNSSEANLENIIIKSIIGHITAYGISCGDKCRINVKNATITQVIDRDTDFHRAIFGTGIANGILSASGGNISVTNTIITKCATGIWNKDGTIDISYSNIYGNFSYSDKDGSYRNDYVGLDPSVGLLIHTNANADSCDAFFNISKDPLFVNNVEPSRISEDPPIYNYTSDQHLTYSSPCVNAGTPDGAPLFDLDGNPRDALPDMGAYEYVSPVAVEESSPKEFRLLRNYPNPFNASTTITYEIPEPGSVTLSIYNIEGQKVRNLVSGYRDAGTHSVNWNGLNDDGLAVSSGLYFIRIEMGRRVDTEKMVLLR